MLIVSIMLHFYSLFLDVSLVMLTVHLGVKHSGIYTEKEKGYGHVVYIHVFMPLPL